MLQFMIGWSGGLWRTQSCGPQGPRSEDGVRPFNMSVLQTPLSKQKQTLESPAQILHRPSGSEGQPAVAERPEV